MTFPEWLAERTAEALVVVAVVGLLLMWIV